MSSAPSSSSHWNVWQRSKLQRSPTHHQFPQPSAARCRPHPSIIHHTSARQRPTPPPSHHPMGRQFRTIRQSSTSTATPMDVDRRLPSSPFRSHRPSSPTAAPFPPNPLPNLSPTRGPQLQSQAAPKSYLQALTSTPSPAWVRRFSSAHTPRAHHRLSSKFPCTSRASLPSPSMATRPNARPAACAFR